MTPPRLVWAIPDGTPITGQPSSLPGTLSFLRLLALAAFIVLAAFLSVLADLEWPAVVGVTALAWAIAATVEWFAWQTGLVWPPQRRYPAGRAVPPATEPLVPVPSPPAPAPFVYAEPPAEEPIREPLYEPEPSPPVEEPRVEAESPAEQEVAETETVAVEPAPADEPRPVGAGLVPPAGEREPKPDAEPEPTVPPAERPQQGRHEEPPAEEVQPEPSYEPEPPPKPVGAGLVPPAGEREPKPDAESEPTVPPDDRLPQERRSWLPQLKRRPPASQTEPPRGEPKCVEARERAQLRSIDTPTAEPASTEAAPEETAVVRMSSRRAPEPQQWNVWDLEAIARQEARAHPARRDEWSYLFVHLRQFADAEGTLPREFDALVRESFGDMLEARNLV